MLDLTVGQLIGIIVAGVAALVAFLKGLDYLGTWIGRKLSKLLTLALEPTNKKLDAIEKKVAANQLENDKTILVRFLADIKNGEELTEIETERLHETYTRYTNAGGNSYIHSEWERLKKEGKL